MRFIVLHDHAENEILVNTPKIRYAVREPGAALTVIAITKSTTHHVKETPTQIRDLANAQS